MVISLIGALRINTHNNIGASQKLQVYKNLIPKLTLSLLLFIIFFNLLFPYCSQSEFLMEYQLAFTVNQTDLLGVLTSLKIGYGKQGKNTKLFFWQCGNKLINWKWWSVKCTISDVQNVYMLLPAYKFAYTFLSAFNKNVSSTLCFTGSIFYALFIYWQVK